MISSLFNAAFSHTQYAGPTIAPKSTVCILSVYLTTWMNLSTQSAKLCRTLDFVGITNAYYWVWGRNIHCSVSLHCLEKIERVFPAGRCSWKWRIWFCGVQLKYDTGKKASQRWKVLSMSPFVYGIQMLWDSGMMPCLSSVYSTL